MQIDIKELLTKNNLNFKTVNFIDSGWDNSVYSVDDLILKVPNREEDRHYVLKEGLVMKYIYENTDIPVPKIHEVGKEGNYILMSKVNGERLSNTNFKNIFPELVDIIEKISKIDSSVLKELGVKESGTLYDRFKKLEESRDIWEPYLSIDSLEYVNKEIRELIDFKDTKPINLFSTNDICFDHVYVIDSKIESIIDWTDCELTDIAYEYGRLIRETLEVSFIENILKSIGKDSDFINRSRIYSILSSIEDIVDGHNANKFDYANEYSNKINTLIELFK
jgi:aminoglycoside phosphotransferase (APT) family kinase protein